MRVMGGTRGYPTKRANALYDYTIAESMLAYAVGGNGQLQIELTMR